ncbi:superinfection immunity protein [Brevundimonas faecalis]|uniref:superinfection immunity protein n=1 Tax=Brevundimonas faecalis TaxID=947378 RepID=UPI00360CD1EB
MFIGFILLLVGYFVPSMIAFAQKRRGRGEILLFNFLLGWTIVGWIAALVMTLMLEREPRMLPQMGASLMPDGPGAIANGAGGSIRFDGREVTIARSGALSFVIHGLAGQKHIALKAIQAVQFRPAGHGVRGYLQLTVLGGMEDRAGALGAAGDENSVLFDIQDQPAFERMAGLIRHAISGEVSPPPYVAPAARVAASPPPVPSASTPDAKPPRSRTIGWIAAIGLSCLAGAAIIVAASNGSGAKAPASSAKEDAVPPAPKSPWRYEEQRNAMTDGTDHWACTTSTNGFYRSQNDEAVTADLCIRQSSEHGLDAYITLNGRGQIDCWINPDCRIKARFDDDPAQSFSGNSSERMEPNIAFIANAERFVRHVKSADVTRLQMSIYAAGEPVLEFNTAGLEWPRPAPAAE